MKSLILSFAAALVALVWLGGASTAQAKVLPEFDEETVELFRTLPVQEDGRVKPLDTVARFKLLRYHGKRTIRLGVTEERDFVLLDSMKFRSFEGEKQKMDSITWLMTTLLYPEVSKDIPLFVVDNTEAVTRLGIDTEKKRDRFSYNELESAREQLIQLSGQYQQKDSKDRTPVESMIAALGINYLDYEFLLHYMSFAADGLPVAADAELPEFLKPARPGMIAVSGLLEAVPKLREAGDSTPVALQEALGRMEFYTGMVNRENILDSQKFAKEGQWDDAIMTLDPFAGSSRSLAILPPPKQNSGGTNTQWLTPSHAILGAMLFDDLRPWSLERLPLLEALESAKGNPAQLKSAVTALREVIVGEAEARGEYAQIEREVSYYDASYFTKSLAWFLIAFVVMCFSWVSPGSKFARILSIISWVLMLFPTYLLVMGIVQRCIIRARPPVSTLYETILFITATAVLVCLIVELIFVLLKLRSWQKIALAAGAFCGIAGMFMGIRFEESEAVDTMPTLQAVLDTNFWLATHVTIINMGYAGGLLAAALSHVYIIGRVFRIGHERSGFYKVVTTLVYGVICFCLLFSLVGTVLGGIWANDSWGRFWGWDPKENGALMIVLWAMVILHARLGGYIKALGIHITSIILGSIVVFSWWGVNNLGVGLHSYGFTEGLWGYLFRFWAVEGFFVALGVLVWFLDGTKKSKKPAGELSSVTS